MNTEEMILLLTNRLNSLNGAIGSAMQVGNADAVNSLTKERLQVELELAALRTQE